MARAATTGAGDGRANAWRDVFRADARAGDGRARVEGVAREDEDGFAYVRGRGDARETYAPRRCATRAEATYATANGTFFDTVSARGVTTFDARTCEALERVDLERWFRERAAFEAMSEMRTFSLHRAWKSFAVMRRYARRRKFTRAKRAFDEASAIFGSAFAERACPATTRVRAACEQMEERARMFCRERVERVDNEPDVFAFDDVDAADEHDATEMKSYDVDAVLANFQSNADESRELIASSIRAIEDEIKVARDGIERRFSDDLDEKLRPMIAATTRYRPRRSSATTIKSSMMTSDGSSGVTPKDAYPCTERALTAALRSKLDSFERAAFMRVRSALSNARSASLDEFSAHVRSCSSLGSNIGALFDVNLCETSLELEPSVDAFERVVRRGAALWTSASLRASVPFGERWNALEDESEYERKVDDVCGVIREYYAAARDAVKREASSLRHRVEALGQWNDQDDPIERFVQVSSRAKEFKKDTDDTPDAIRPDGCCFAVNVRALKGALRPAAISVSHAAGEAAVSHAADRANVIATKLTKMKLDTTGKVDVSDQFERAQSTRREFDELSEAYATLKRLGVKIPDLHVAAFDALGQEIDAVIKSFETSDANDAPASSSP